MAAAVRLESLICFVGVALVLPALERQASRIRAGLFRFGRARASEPMDHASALSPADFRVGVPALAGPIRLKAILQPSDRALTKRQPACPRSEGNVDREGPEDWSP